MQSSGENKPNIAVTRQDMAMLRLSQLPMSSFGLLAVSFAQQIMDRGQANTYSYPMFTMDYLEEGEAEAAQPKVNISPVLNLDLSFLLQEMEKAEDDRRKQFIIAEKESELRLQEIRRTTEKAISNTEIIEKTIANSIENHAKNEYNTTQNINRQQFTDQQSINNHQNIDQQTVSNQQITNQQFNSERLILHETVMKDSEAKPQISDKDTEKSGEKTVIVTSSEAAIPQKEAADRENKAAAAVQNAVQQNEIHNTVVQGDHIENIQYRAGDTDLHIELHADGEGKTEDIRLVKQGNVYRLSAKNSDEATRYHTRLLLEKAASMQQQRLTRPGVAGMRLLGTEAAASMAQAIEAQQQQAAQLQQPIQTRLQTPETPQELYQAYLGKDGEIYYVQESETPEASASQQSKTASEAMRSLEKEIARFTEAVAPAASAAKESKNDLTAAAANSASRAANEASRSTAATNSDQAGSAAVKNSKEPFEDIKSTKAALPETERAGAAFAELKISEEKSAEAELSEKKALETLPTGRKTLQTVYLPNKQRRQPHRALGAWSASYGDRGENMATPQIEMLFSKVLQGEQELGLTYGKSEGGVPRAPQERDEYLKGTTGRIARREQLAEAITVIPPRTLPPEELAFLQTITERPDTSEPLLSAAERVVYRTLQLSDRAWAIPEGIRENFPPISSSDVQGTSIAKEAVVRNQVSPEVSSSEVMPEEFSAAPIAKMRVDSDFAVAEEGVRTPNQVLSSIPAETSEQNETERLKVLPAETEYLEVSQENEEAENRAVTIKLPKELTSPESEVRESSNSAEIVSESKNTLQHPENKNFEENTQTIKRSKAEQKRFFDRLIQFIQGTDAGSEPIAEEEAEKLKAQSVSFGHFASAEGIRKEGTTHAVQTPITMAQGNAAEAQHSSSFVGTLSQPLSLEYLTEPEEDPEQKASAPKAESKNAAAPSALTSAKADTVSASRQVSAPASQRNRIEADEQLAESMSELISLQAQQDGMTPKKASFTEARAIHLTQPLSGESAAAYIERMEREMGETVYLADADQTEQTAVDQAKATRIADKIRKAVHLDSPYQNETAVEYLTRVGAKPGEAVHLPVKENAEQAEKKLESVKATESVGFASERISERNIYAGKTVLLMQPQSGESAVDYVTRLQMSAPEIVYLTEPEAAEAQGSVLPGAANTALTPETVNDTTEHEASAQQPSVAARDKKAQTAAVMPERKAAEANKIIRLSQPKSGESAAEYLIRLQAKIGETVYVNEAKPEKQARRWPWRRRTVLEESAQSRAIRLIEPKPGEQAISYIIRLQREGGEIVYLTKEESAEAQGSVTSGAANGTLSPTRVNDNAEPKASQLTSSAAREKQAQAVAVMPERKAEEANKIIRLSQPKSGESAAEYLTRLQAKIGETVYVSEQKKDIATENKLTESAASAPSRAIRLIEPKPGEQAISYIIRLQREGGEIVYLTKEESAEAQGSVTSGAANGTLSPTRVNDNAEPKASQLTSSAAREKQAQAVAAMTERKAEEANKIIRLSQPKSGESAAEYLTRLQAKIGETVYVSEQKKDIATENKLTESAASAPSRAIRLIEPKPGEQAISYITRLQREGGEIFYLTEPETAESKSPGKQTIPAECVVEGRTLLRREKGNTLLLAKPKSGESAAEYLLRIRHVPGETVYLPTKQPLASVRSTPEARRDAASMKETILTTTLPPVEQEYLTETKPQTAQPDEASAGSSRMKSIVFRREESGKTGTGVPSQEQAARHDSAQRPVEMSYIAQGGAETPQNYAEPGRVTSGTGKKESDFYKALPSWAKDFIDKGYQENADKSKSIVGGSFSEDKEEKKANNIVWSAPQPERNDRRMEPPQDLTLKQPKSSEEGTTQTYISDREIRRAADKVYKIIEERLRNERRRRGL